MTMFATPDEARYHLRGIDLSDEYLTGLIEAVSERIIEHVKVVPDPVPARIKHATLMMVGYAAEDPAGLAGERGLPAPVAALLSGLRSPTIA